MRPIVMDMNGFASFREQTRVDFTDADFFALVGPTGAGKSTVIDAMTFALYGSVPRWGRKDQVSLALAPTVTRATVKLVFEVDRQRYVVARELRRMGSQVRQRSVSLERVLDPGGLAEKGDKTAPMAKDIDGVADAVERLLGLSYEDFTQCVVLPQEKFADFLRAQPAIRQKILLRLLGAEHYEQMMVKANQRASVAAQRVETIGESLLNYADATEDSEERSRAAQVTLTALADQVTQTLPRIGERQAELSAAEEELRRLRADHAALSVLRVPDDIAELDANLTASQAEVVRLKKAEQEAEHADTAARQSLVAGPQRAPLELARERRGERKRLQDRVPTLEAEASQLADRVEAASAAVETGSAALEGLRGRRDEAARDWAAAGELVSRLEHERAALAAVSVPDGVAVLDERRQAAVTAVAEAARTLAEAEHADTAARQSLVAGPQRAPLELARERRGERKRLQDRVPTLEAEASQLADRVEAASAAVETGSAALEGLRGRRDEAARDWAAAGELVSRLEHERAALAAVSVPDGVAVLDERRQAAVTAVAEAARTLAEAEHADTAARGARDATVSEAPLAQVSRDLNDLRAVLADLETTRHAAEQARAALTSAETELPNATEALRKQREALEEAHRAHVVAGLRPHLVAGEACPLCDQTVTTLPAAITAPELDDMRSRLTEAERAERNAQNVAKKVGLSVVKAESELKSTVARQTSLIASLADVLVGPLASAPLLTTRAIAATDTADAGKKAIDASLVDRALTEIGALARERAELDQAATRAAKEAEAQRSRHRAAQLAAQRADQDVSDARDALRIARDPLVALGAPRVDAANLATGWAMVATWAGEQKQARVTDLATAREAASVAASRHRAAGAEFDDADQALARLRAEARKADTDYQQASARLRQAIDRVAELDRLLQGSPGEEQITEQLALLGRLEDAAAKAGDGLRTARAVRAKGETALAALERAEGSARVRLSSARDSVVALGAPALDELGLLDAWTELATWAGEQKQARVTDLATAREAASVAASRHRAAGAEFDDADQALARLRAEARKADTDYQQASARLRQAIDRVAELDRLLQGSPDEEQITEQLALLGRLEDAAAKAGDGLRTARAVRAKGETALAALERAEGSARVRLSSARDSVVALGAPALDELGLLDAWTELATWASGQATSREHRIATASAEAYTTQAVVGQLTAELSAALAEAAIELTPDAIATRAAPAVAAALERARAATKRIVERRAEAAELRTRHQAAQEEQQVARLLGDLLRANNFQRWLVNATVDDLVEEASATLSALSSGQFDLAYDDGDFYVIDHTDADARRSVRTLSGGETFQASLALALALSSQISALAAAGAARLDSIFLDEGFGTLDPETLEVVATTLETLAQGERMVAVVTHVPALAERVPVRFRVTRNARTSIITREGFATAADEEVMA